MVAITNTTLRCRKAKRPRPSQKMIPFSDAVSSSMSLLPLLDFDALRWNSLRCFALDETYWIIRYRTKRKTTTSIHFTLLHWLTALCCCSTEWMNILISEWPTASVVCVRVWLCSLFLRCAQTCILLYCIVLYCIVLCYIVLYCIGDYYTVARC